ncbi:MULTISPECIES: GNAT family N-acetyltransferase [unclassified Roseateles]|uniref:GNAT family N-acetyltransferase n=1 Tax=unclassified Roseateles TaxID=2626991 RepID=UPI0006FD30FD|nr:MULTISPECIES: GNAT family N-acetyltransferase [unclassified Roseateles]KQW43351.1 guanosine monophosphate synthetase [Pelomonas sp. Root405]KRA71089.1 guanosine monophosphate synthetase [Pelomonas sp. Root662]
MTVLITPRLRLEPLDDNHFDGLFRLNSDPVVMRYITGRSDTPADTRSMIDRVKARWAEFGYSWWGFVRRDTGELIGTGCIQHLNRDPGEPLETGWRLRQDAWGEGYASEAARHMVGWAFKTLKPELICAVCQPENTPSSAVMERLGMSFTGTGRWYDMDCSRYDITAAQWAACPAKTRYDAEA